MPQPQQTAKPIFYWELFHWEKLGCQSNDYITFFTQKQQITESLRKNRTGNLQNGELVHLPWVKWMRFEMYQNSNLYCIGERIFSSSLGCSHGILINMLQINWRPNQNVDHQILSYNSLGHNFGFRCQIHFSVFAWYNWQVGSQHKRTIGVATAPRIRDHQRRNMEVQGAKK